MIMSEKFSSLKNITCFREACSIMHSILKKTAMLGHMAEELQNTKPKTNIVFLFKLTQRKKTLWQLLSNFLSDKKIKKVFKI